MAEFERHVEIADDADGAQGRPAAAGDPAAVGWDEFACRLITLFAVLCDSGVSPETEEP
jgi:hypothetical protein